jgi:DNA-directed RNA polymerase II subunit RPB2
MLGDGTIYIDIDHKSIYDNLEKHNYHKHGNEILYNGQTGRQINTEIFIGPTYYFRVKHMVAEKINARGKGPMTQLTRQPTGGRRKEGGLRIGEMERDSLISHGISGFIQESMMERSDKYRWQVCKKCGTIPNYSTKINSAYCPNCNTNETSVIETPYCMKLLSQELETMNVQMRFNCGHVTVPIEELELSASDNEDNDNIDNQTLQKFLN